MSAPLVERVAVAQAVAAAVAGVPGVARLSGGAGIEAATLYPGGKVTGVKVADHRVAVHLVASQLPLPALVGEVRAAARAALASLGFEHSIDVVVESLDLDQLPPAASAGEGLAQPVTVGQGGR